MKVLFADDEARRMTPIVEELQDHGYSVVFEASVDDALARVSSNEEFDLVILDISLPPGQSFQSEETDGGTRTGLHFYDSLRRLRPSLKVVIFTNVADPTLRDYFRKEDQTICKFVRKPAVLPFQFVEEIERFLGTKS